MRIYGRIPVPFPPSGIVDSQQFQYGNYQWVVIQTDANGSDDYCYITALIQCLRLNLNESPFWAQFGLPAETLVMMQVQPDYYTYFIQNFFSQFFASLIISKRPQVPTNESFAVGGIPYTTPIYDISIVRHDGTIYNNSVGI